VVHLLHAVERRVESRLPGLELHVELARTSCLGRSVTCSPSRSISVDADPARRQTTSKSVRRRSQAEPPGASDRSAMIAPSLQGIERSAGQMVIMAADYPFMDVLWTMLIFFLWVVWIWIVVTVLIDVFRRHDIGGFAKAAWLIFVVVLPWLGVLIYLISQHDGMRDRGVKQAQAQRQAFDDYVRDAAGGSAGEIAKAKELLDAGTITQAEFDALKAKALT